jgi:uncharacterized repeat protein (TIGR01451 family)
VILYGGSAAFSNVVFSNNSTRGGDGGNAAGNAAAYFGWGAGGGVGGDGGNAQGQVGGDGGVFGGGAALYGWNAAAGGHAGDGAGGHSQDQQDDFDPCGGYGGGSGGGDGSLGTGPNACTPGFGGGGGGNDPVFDPARNGRYGGSGGCCTLTDWQYYNVTDGAVAGGGGGGGLGGAIFVRTGSLYLLNTTFTNNMATAGSGGGSGAADGYGVLPAQSDPGEAKGGAVFADAPGFIYDLTGNQFSGNSAGGAGVGTSCQGPSGTTITDTSNYCGGVINQSLNLGVTLQRTGPFVRSQAVATYSVTFSTQQLIPTTPYSVALALPSNFRLTSLSGTGWTCTVSSASCAYSGMLPANTNLPNLSAVGTLDEQGGSFTATATLTGPAATPSTSSDTVNVQDPNLNVVFTQQGNVLVPGSNPFYTYNVINNGPTALAGTFTINNVMPTHVTGLSASGTSWVCQTQSGMQQTCTYTAGTAGLAPGASLPPLTILVAANSNGPASSPFGSLTLNNGGAANYVTYVALTPNLAVAVSAPPFALRNSSGVTTNYTITNVGPGIAYAFTINTRFSVDPGASLTALSGSGWNCDAVIQQCSRPTDLAPGSSAPLIATVLKIDPVPPAFTNEVMTVTDTNTGQAPVTVKTDLELVALSVTASPLTVSLEQGQVGATTLYTVSSAIYGGLATGPFTLQLSPGTGLTLTGLSGTGWNCTLATQSCTRSDPLSPSTSYPAIQAVMNVSGSAAATVTQTANLMSSISATPVASTSLTQNVATTLLTLQLSHSGAFAKGQTGTYSMTVLNAGKTATSDVAVQVTDNLPTVLTATNISGNGWSCTLSPASCSRSDSLQPGFAYPPITLTVSVDSATTLTTVTNTSTLTLTGATPFTAADTVTFGALPAVTLQPPSPSAPALSQMVTLTANVTGNTGSGPTGTVLFLDNGNVLGGATINNQLATYQTNLLQPGKHFLQAIYAGDNNYGGGSSKLQSITITAPGTLGQFVSAGKIPAGTPASNVSRLLAFDYNRDGITDLLIPLGPLTVGVMRGNGDGTFSLQQTIHLPGTVFQAVSTDLNGDGLPDLVIGGGFGVETLVQDGTGAFISPPGPPSSNIISVPAGVISIVSGDFNQDGRADIAFAIGTGFIDVRLGNGDGTYFSIQGYHLGNNLLASITIGDFNSDGKPDLLVNDNVGTAYVLLNLGGGVFANAVTTNIGANANQVAVGDFNGDGFPDIAVTSSQNLFDPNAQVCIFPGNGNGAFRAPVAGGGCISAPTGRGVAVGDFNGDGVLDLAFVMYGDQSSNPSGGSVNRPTEDSAAPKLARSPFSTGTPPILPGMGVALGFGNGALHTPQIYPTDPGSSDVMIADFNGDGVNDIATYNYTGASVSLFLGSAPRWATTIAPTGSLTQGQVGAQYTIIVTNTGTGPSIGLVNAVVTFPSGGITATSLSGGIDWQCTLATLTCVAANIRPAGTSYLPIVVTVNIAASAPLQVTAAVSVSGGFAPNIATAQVNSPTAANTVQLSLGTSLTGATVTATVNGTSYTLPATVVVPANQPATIAVASPQPGATGVRYVFADWSDGGAVSHTITPAANVTLSVDFAMQFQLTTSVNPLNAGTVTPGGWYSPGTQMTLTATTNPGFVFSLFSGAPAGTNNPVQFPLNGPMNVVANFSTTNPALSAAIQSKSNGANANQRVWRINVGNSGQGIAGGVTISAATVTIKSGPGPVTVASTLPLTVGDIPAGTALAADLVLNYPVTSPATIISLQLTLAANGGTYSTSVTFNSQLR